jgi:hypothetical protein
MSAAAEMRGATSHANVNGAGEIFLRNTLAKPFALRIAALLITVSMAVNRNSPLFI